MYNKSLLLMLMNAKFYNYSFVSNRFSCFSFELYGTILYCGFHFFMNCFILLLSLRAIHCLNFQDMTKGPADYVVKVLGYPILSLRQFFTYIVSSRIIDTSTVFSKY